jgi:glycosyltransferase involved in cell wall biosynthesis
MPTCAIVSFRLGSTDGVSIVAESWRRCLERLGFATITVAGEGPVDRRVEGLAIGAAPPPRDEVEAALADADLVVVENLCTIPLNLPAARTMLAVLRGRPAVMHHHDPPWQRPHFSQVTELPVDDSSWRHVTINELTRGQFIERGLTATTIYNGFDVHEPDGDRRGTRAQLDVADDELLVAHPVRAIPRKGIPAAIRLCEEIGATYWLLGPAEDGYDDELDALLDSAQCRVIHAPLPHSPDIYAAPDLVAFPSTWEGFGNPPIEAAIHHRMTAIGPYPVARELTALGFTWVSATDAEAARNWLTDPDQGVLDANRDVAVEHFSFERVADQLRALLAGAGWLP